MSYKTCQLGLYKETTAVCSEIRTKYINVLCVKNVELLNAKPGGNDSNFQGSVQVSRPHRRSVAPAMNRVSCLTCILAIVPYSASVCLLIPAHSEPKFNLLKSSGLFTYHRASHSKILHGARFALRVLYRSQNRQRLLLYKSLTDWFL